MMLSTRPLKKSTTLQKKTFNYTEVNLEKQKKFLAEIEIINPKNLVYSDESGIDDNEVPLKGWAPRGLRCNASKNAERKTRYNLIASLNNKNLFASFLFEGTMTDAIYETYIEKILVIDNASTHKSKRTDELIRAAGCRILVPPYSPHLSPIEYHWAAFKAAIRSAAENVNDFFSAAVQTLAETCGS